MPPPGVGGVRGLFWTSELGQSEKQQLLLLLFPVPRRFVPMALPRAYPPFGFSVWYDRHRGKGWCWRERRPSGPEDDVTEGKHLPSRLAGIEAVRAELRRRGARDVESDDPGVDST